MHHFPPKLHSTLKRFTSLLSLLFLLLKLTFYELPLWLLFPCRLFLLLSFGSFCHQPRKWRMRRSRREKARGIFLTVSVNFHYANFLIFIIFPARGCSEMRQLQQFTSPIRFRTLMNQSRMAIRIIKFRDEGGCLINFNLSLLARNVSTTKNWQLQLPW